MQLHLLQLLSCCQISQLSGYCCINHHSRLCGQACWQRPSYSLFTISVRYIQQKKCKQCNFFFYFFSIYAFYIFQHFLASCALPLWCVRSLVIRNVNVLNPKNKFPQAPALPSMSRMSTRQDKKCFQDILRLNFNLSAFPWWPRHG